MNIEERHQRARIFLRREIQLIVYFSVFLATMGIALKWRSLSSIYYISLNRLKSVFRMPYPTELTIAEAKIIIFFFFEK